MLIASTPDKKNAIITIHERVNGALTDIKALSEKDFPAAADKALFTTYHAKAKELAERSKAPPRGSPPPAQSNKLHDLRTLQQQVAALEEQLIQRIEQNACPWLGTGCFAAGTKLLTRRGWVAVELLAVGDELASRAEGDPGAEIEWQAVEACFRRTGRVLHLHFTDGELIRTTPEHPFWVKGEGWVPAGALKAGDQLSTLSGEWVRLREVYDTEQWEPTYNVRVANTHTYFVGDEGWGFSLWAHNDYAQARNELATSPQLARLNGGSAQVLNKLKGIQELESFLKDSARIRVMPVEDFHLELNDILRKNGCLTDPVLTSSNPNVAQSMSTAVQKLALENVQFKRPSQLPNPFAKTRPKNGYNEFQADVLASATSIDGRNYAKYWDLLNTIYTTSSPVNPKSYHLERLVEQFPGGKHSGEMFGLNWALQRIEYYFTQGQLAEVDAPHNRGRVDIKLTDGNFVDAKVLKQTTWDGWSEDQKNKYISNDIVKKTILYLQGNSKTLRFEFKPGTEYIDVNVIRNLVRLSLSEEMMLRVTIDNT